MAENKTKNNKNEIAKSSNLAEKPKLPVSARGRIFKGAVVRKFPKRITIEFTRTLHTPKYERFYKKKTRIHARLPLHLENEVNIGDLVNIQECRPLSKIIHHIVIAKIKSAKLKAEAEDAKV